MELRVDDSLQDTNNGALLIVRLQAVKLSVFPGEQVEQQQPGTERATETVATK